MEVLVDRYCLKSSFTHSTSNILGHEKDFLLLTNQAKVCCNNQGNLESRELMQYLLGCWSPV
jgi:hypothetical protein